MSEYLLLNNFLFFALFVVGLSTIMSSNDMALAESLRSWYWILSFPLNWGEEIAHLSGPLRQH